jgi:hypothetical protein
MYHVAEACDLRFEEGNIFLVMVVVNKNEVSLFLKNFAKQQERK